MSNSSIRYPTAPISDLESTEVVTLSNSLIIDQPDSTRKTTLASILSSLGIMRCISFSKGGVLESQKDIAFYEEDGTFYTWNGPYPKIVEAESTPKESGGVGSNAWINNKDTPLVRVWKYRASVDGETVIQLPTDIPVVGVQAIYVQGVRQDIGEGFSYDEGDATITLADELEAGNLVTVIIGVDPDSNKDIFAALKNSDGASNVGTLAGITVEEALSNNAALRQDLSSETGALMVSRNASPLGRIIRASLFEYLTESDQQALLTTSGAVVAADYALKAAIAAGVMVLDIPWNLGIIELGSDPATLPLGFSLVGWSCRRPYTVADDSSFLNCGVVIRVAAGARFPFYSTGRHVFRDIVFDGRDKTTYLFYSADKSAQFNGTRLEGCGIYRFAIGIGWDYEGTAKYIATVKAHFCSISGNKDGVKNLIDSMMIGCTINSNDRGVALVGGANSNFFGGCRNEWNAGDNWYAYESIENQISGELCDRAGRGGVVAGKDSSWFVTGVVVARSGANQPEGDNYSANFVIIDNGKIVISGVRTRNGAKEWGQGGTNSPSFNVSVLGSGGGTLLVSGSDMTGFVTSAINQKAPTLNKSITGNLGMDDDVNVGMTQVIKGRRIIGAQSSGRLPATVGATLSFTQDNIVQDLYDTYVTRAILIECRIGNTAQSDCIKIPVVVRHERNFYLDTITSGIVASSGRIGFSGTGVTVGLSIDSSTGVISVVLTSVDGLVRDVNVSLLPSM